MYASENLGISGHHPDGSFPRLRRFRIRKDGFASVRAGAAGGALVTKPLVFAGARLTVNYDARLDGGGQLEVEILDEDRDPVPGFASGDCDALAGNAIDQPVTWNGKGDVGSLAGKSVHFAVRFGPRRPFLFQVWRVAGMFGGRKIAWIPGGRVPALWVNRG